MSHHTLKQKIATLGIDLSKNIFQLHGANSQGKAVMKKKLKRSELISFVANIPPCLIGIEACGGSHHWARIFSAYGHKVRIMAPQFVKPFVKSNKNDAQDAEAICEAVTRPSMRFVPQKSIEQQDLQSLHRIRSQVVSRRTALANQIRGLLTEYGLVIPKGISHVRKHIPMILEDGENQITPLFRELLDDLYQDLVGIDERVELLNQKLKQLSQNNDDCQRLLTIPGIGILGATALAAAIGDVSVFKNGRELAAWIGLVPKQHSSGGRSVLLGISKRGDPYLRTLLIHGGRAVVRTMKDDNQWACDLKNRRGKNITAVAVANKNARIAWAVLSRKSVYQKKAA